MLVERLCWPVDSDHVRVNGKETYYRAHLSEARLDLPESAVDHLAASLPANHSCLVFGVGLGEIVARLVAQQTGAIVAWDRDPWLLRLALSRHDFSHAILAGRLRLAMGADILTLADQLGATANPPEQLAIVEHPLLRAVYRREFDLLSFPNTRPLAFVGAGGLLVDDLSRSLTAEGFRVFTLDFQRLSLEELEWTVERYHPRLLATINYTHGLAEFASQHAIPLVSWEIDPSDEELRPLRCVSNQVHLFTYRRANVDVFRAAGFTRVEYLPLAADPDTRHPISSAPDLPGIQASVSFVGSSLEAERQSYARKYHAHVDHYRLGSPEWATTLLETALQEQAQDWSHYSLPEIFDRLLPHVPAQIRRTLAHCAGEIAAAERRREYVRRLMPYGIEVWGDAAWSAAVGDAYQGLAGHFEQLTGIYCRSVVNLDVNRLYQTDIVPMRIFDVLATGSFVLAEHSAALEELFDLGVEVDSYRTPAEMVAKVDFYLRHPEFAADIARRGRTAILERHTVRHRVRHMLDRAAVVLTAEGLELVRQD